MPKAAKKLVYKSHLSYLHQGLGESGFIARGNVLSCMPKALASARGAWTVRGVTDWNHATEMLKQHNDSTRNCKDGGAGKTTTGTVVDLQLAASKYINLL